MASVVVAAVQPTPVFLDRDATVRATAGDCGTEAVASLRAAIDHALGR